MMFELLFGRKTVLQYGCSVGDEVIILSNGSLATIKSRTREGNKPAYLVRKEDGLVVKVSEDAVWLPKFCYGAVVTIPKKNGLFIVTEPRLRLSLSAYLIQELTPDGTVNNHVDSEHLYETEFINSEKHNLFDGCQWHSMRLLKLGAANDQYLATSAELFKAALTRLVTQND